MPYFSSFLPNISLIYLFIQTWKNESKFCFLVNLKLIRFIWWLETKHWNKDLIIIFLICINLQELLKPIWINEILIFFCLLLVFLLLTGVILCPFLLGHLVNLVLVFLVNNFFLFEVCQNLLRLCRYFLSLIYKYLIQSYCAALTVCFLMGSHLPIGM